MLCRLRRELLPRLPLLRGLLIQLRILAGLRLRLPPPLVLRLGRLLRRRLLRQRLLPVGCWRHAAVLLVVLRKTWRDAGAAPRAYLRRHPRHGCGR